MRNKINYNTLQSNIDKRLRGLLLSEIKSELENWPFSFILRQLGRVFISLVIGVVLTMLVFAAIGEIIFPSLNDQGSTFVINLVSLFSFGSLFVLYMNNAIKQKSISSHRKDRIKAEEFQKLIKGTGYTVRWYMPKVKGNDDLSFLSGFLPKGYILINENTGAIEGHVTSLSSELDQKAEVIKLVPKSE